MARKSIGLDITAFGDERLVRDFEALPGKIQKKIGRKVLRAGAKIVADKAKILAPVDTGALRRSIKVRAMKRSRTRIGYIAFSNVRYAFAVEYGRPRKGVPGNPFMTVASDTSKNRVFKVMGKLTGDLIEEELRVGRKDLIGDA